MEAWTGWSLRRQRSPHASLTPYHPTTIWGPYVRGQVGMLLSPAENRYLSYEHTLSLFLGIRMHLRMFEGEPEIPEVQ